MHESKWNHKWPFKCQKSFLLCHLLKINKTQNEIPYNYSLSQNYPNPFNPNTKIDFNLPKSEYVSLKIYNILGKEVATLVNSTLNAGKYTIDFDATRLSSGTYFYVIKTEGYTSQKKMTLIK